MRNRTQGANKENESDNEVQIMSGLDRGVGKRVSKPTEFFEVTYPENHHPRKPKVPKRRQRDASDNNLSSADSDSSSVRSIPRRLPQRAARIEFERRLKKGSLEEHLSSSSSSSDSDSSSSSASSDGTADFRKKVRRAGKEKVRRRHADNEHAGAANSSSSDDDGDDSDAALSSIDDRGSSAEGSVAHLESDDDVEVSFHLGDYARAVRNRVSLNTKLHDLLDAHRSKLELIKSEELASAGTTKKSGPPKNIDVVSLDPVTFQDVGGLPGHIVSLREMLLLPLTYPHLFQRLGVKTPRGVLFCGSPGNGKTLMARALACECSRIGAGGQKVTFFARKGADIMCKWVGEGERQLSALFAEARRQSPSIIFFDEIDGLAPVRHMKQESSHASVVSTLLALMDGLDDRGQVVVIGATNRPDTLDPALRRPGRFDRELHFDYPNAAARQHILGIHTKKWNLSDAHLRQIAEETHGFAGADLSALCAEACLVSLRRFCPHMFISGQRYDVNPDQLHVTLADFLTAARSMVPSSHRSRNLTDMNDTALRRCLGEGTRQDVLLTLRKNWHSAAEQHRQQVDTADAEASFLKLIRPPAMADMSRSSALVVLTVEHSSPKTSAVEAAAACNVDVLGRAFPGSLVCSYCFASGAVAGIDSSMLFDPDGAFAPAVSASSGSFSSVTSFLSTTLKFGKVIMVLTGTESMSEEPDEDADAPIRWLFDAVSHRDCAIIVPTSGAALKTHPNRLRSLFGSSLYSKAVFENSPGVRVSDLETALAKIIIPDLSASVLTQFPQAPPVIPDDDEMNDETGELLSLSRRVALTDEWHKILFKRTQLRTAIRDVFISLSSKDKFAMFASRDLDLDHIKNSSKKLIRQWRRHFAKNPVTLKTISDKIDGEQYKALSQFNSDIERITSNVTKFFGMDKFGRRYRDRAKQLKEEILMQNFKMNRSVALFCEDHMHAKAPAFLNNKTNHRNNNNSRTPGGRNTPGHNNNKITPAARRPSTHDDTHQSGGGTASSHNHSSSAGPKQKSHSSSSSGSSNSNSSAADLLLGGDNHPATPEASSTRRRRTHLHLGTDDDNDDDDSGDEEVVLVDSRHKNNSNNNSNHKNGRSNSRNNSNSAGKKLHQDAAEDHQHQKNDDGNDADNEEEDVDDVLYDDKDFPPHGLRIGRSLPRALVAELRAALRQCFNIPAKASPTDPVRQSLNRCEHVLCFEFPNNDKVKRVKAKIESTVSGGSSLNSSPSVAQALSMSPSLRRSNGQSSSAAAASVGGGGGGGNVNHNDRHHHSENRTSPRRSGSWRR